MVDPSQVAPISGRPFRFPQSFPLLRITKVATFSMSGKQLCSYFQRYMQTFIRMAASMWNRLWTEELNVMCGVASPGFYLLRARTLQLCTGLHIYASEATKMFYEHISRGTIHFCKYKECSPREALAIVSNQENRNFHVKFIFDETHTNAGRVWNRSTTR